MGEYGCKRLVYASSAAVYGNAGSAPIDEGVPVCPLSPFAASQAAVEAVLQDLSRADAGWHVAVLRLFEVVGGHSSGMLHARRAGGELCELGECGDAGGTMAALARVARGEERSLRVYGNKLPTPDGTPVRDYVHVVDAAEAFVGALFALDVQLRGFTVLNIGSGKGSSVLELADTFARAHGIEVPHVAYPASAREPPVLVADVQRAKRVLQWQPRRALLQMCVDACDRQAHTHAQQ
jgi:UDP-glucose 4-epimerase